jgi:hypothetical protein
MCHKDVITVFVAVNSKYVKLVLTFCVVVVDSNVSTGNLPC